MRRRRRTLAEHVVRSLAASAVVYAAVAACAIPAAVQADPDLAGPDARPAAEPGWRPAYGQRYPGCEDLADWAGGSFPRTVVVVSRDGGLARLPFDDAYAHSIAGGAGGPWAVGACR